MLVPVLPLSLSPERTSYGGQNLKSYHPRTIHLKRLQATSCSVLGIMAQSKAYDINASEWPKYSGFRALQGGRAEIRLLQLESGANTKSLRYVMRHAELHGSPKYAAVSYSWGAPVPVTALSEILIHGESVLIRPTLYSFLETVTLHRPGMDLWIDALCINQGDVQERNQQISIMGEIFKTAQEVYVWLGLGDDDTNYAMEHIEDSHPQTRFDQRIFSTCAEHLLRASYWTRRWVIQEFALAQELTVVCGGRLTKWHTLTKKINDRILGGDALARRTLKNFTELRLLGSKEPKSLLKLMEQFQDARCIDRRDTAFSLLGVAKDGDRLLPRYDESVADVYFRVLSMLPTKRVLPKMSGYRWPHQAASRFLSLMQITRRDVFKSLAANKNDRLYTVLEYTGHIATVQESQGMQPPHPINKFSSFPLEVRLRESTTVFCGSGRLVSGGSPHSLL